MLRRLSTLVAIVTVLAVSRPARADLTVVFFDSQGSETAPPEEAATAPPPVAEPAPELVRAVDDAPPAPDPAAITPLATVEPPRETTPPPEPGPVAPPALIEIRARVVRVGDGSGESDTLLLRGVDGAPGADALDRLSLLARPRGTDAPATIDTESDEWIAPGIRRLHAGLLPLLARLAEHFPGRALEIVSGYRPSARSGSRHRFGRALDLRVEGVSIEEIRALLDDEPHAGIGVYPTSGFVHLDVRSERVRWVDESGPGEATHVVVTDVGPASGAPETPPTAPVITPDSPAEPSAEEIERALRSADGIVLDLGPLDARRER